MRGDPAFSIDQIGFRKRIQAAVEFHQLFAAESDSIIDFLFGKVGFDDRPPVLIHGDSDYREALVAVCFVEFYKPGDLSAARHAVSGPEIEQDYFAFVAGQTEISAG